MPAQAQSDEQSSGKIIARRTDDDRIEFGWQTPSGARVFPRQRYFPANAPEDRWLRSSPVEVDGAAIGRINARLRAGGRIEFAFTPTDGERILPPSRYFPHNATRGRWLRSTEITIGPPAATSGYTAVSASYARTCAIRASDGAIECWGDNAYGATDAPDGSYIAISAGDFHTCAIRAGGAIECWGKRYYWDTDAPADAPDGSFSAVSANSLYACAIRTTGAIACWGSNFFGQSDAPAGSFSAVSAGAVHTCAIRASDGAIACWGSDGTRATDASEGSYIAVAASAYHTCAIRDTGEIACWGSDGTRATDAPAGSYTAVSTGDFHTCAIRESGEITCWGSNFYGQFPVQTE